MNTENKGPLRHRPVGDELVGLLEREAQELERRSYATGKDAEPAGWLLDWEAKGIRRAIEIVRAHTS